jgi:hypothetical protein
VGSGFNFEQFLGLELEGEAPVEGSSVDRIVGLSGVRLDVAMLWGKVRWPSDTPASSGSHFLASRDGQPVCG